MSETRKRKAPAVERAEQIEGWAWEILVRGRWELCYWMAHSRTDLLAEQRPSSEARIVRVVMQRKAACREA